MYTFSVTLWHTPLTIFSCWSQRPMALSDSDLGRLPRYRRIAKSLNFSRKLKIPCCHNTRWLVLLCGGERERLSGGGGGGGGGREGLKSITKWISSTWTAFIPLSGPVHKYPDIFKKEILSPFYVRPQVNGVFGQDEKQVFENGPQTRGFCKRRFSFTCGRSKPGKRFRIQWCQTSYTPNLYACSVVFHFYALIVFHRREKTIQIHFMWTRIFWKTDKLISVFKNIWIRVDILKLNIAGTFPLSYWFKAFSRF